MTFKYLSHLLMAVLCGTLLTACTINIPPADEYSDPDAISGLKQARSLLASTYALYPHCEFDLSVMGEDFMPTNYTNKDISKQNLYSWKDSEITTMAENLWLQFYNTIASCNTLLERVEKIEVTNDNDKFSKTAIISEAKTLKALCYFKLLQLYAPAYDRNPQADGIILTDKVGLKFPKRSSIATCTDSIRALLTQATGVNNVPTANGWLSRKAAIYLQAEVELYAENYSKAIQLAEDIIKDCSTDMFTQGGIESLWTTTSNKNRIFAFYNDGSYYTSIQFGAANGDYFAVNPNISFTPEDHRTSSYVLTFNMDGAPRTLLGKYNKNLKAGTDNRYIDMMRPAGAYFIAAESYAQLGQNAKAISTINAYLNAVKATPLTETLTGETLIDAVLQEKQKEFVGEGQGFLDLKRLHKRSIHRGSAFNKGIISTIKADDYRWTFPIPRSEYRYNENVTQNEGWPLNR